MRDVRVCSARGADRAQRGFVSVPQEAFIATLRMGGRASFVSQGDDEGELSVSRIPYMLDMLRDYHGTVGREQMIDHSKERLSSIASRTL